MPDRAPRTVRPAGGTAARSAGGTSPDGGHEVPAELHDQVERALRVLLDPELEPIVDMALTRREGAYEAHSADGSVRFRREGSGFAVLETSGHDPLGDQSTDRFSPLAQEVAARYPHRTVNAYPHAHEQVSQLFDSPDAPDLCVIHSAAHNWEDQGGHRGEHGSLGVVQARAPFILSGAGVASRGVVDGSIRLVDVAPTLAALAGCAPLDDDGTHLAHQDGTVQTDLLDTGARRPAHLVGLLFDGTNANVLHDMAQRGELPNVARLIANGTMLRHGAIASLPTVTLANHTTILTGAHPGHHGILHNAWWNRRRGEQVITNSPATWPTAMSHLESGVDTLFSAFGRTWPDAFTAACNEPCDLDASYSTFDYFRRGEIPPIPDSPAGLPHVTERFVRPSKDYAWASVVDHMCVEQACGLWAGEYRGRTNPLPRFTWCNFTLTDAAMHEGGPHSEIAAASLRDSDARIGEVIAAVERAGAFDDTAFVLLADHGMEETDPSCTGDWGIHLRAEGLQLRDEGYGFLYLGVN